MRLGRRGLGRLFFGRDPTEEYLRAAISMRKAFLET